MKNVYSKNNFEIVLVIFGCEVKENLFENKNSDWTIEQRKKINKINNKINTLYLICV